MVDVNLSEAFKTFLFSYRHDGASWCLEIQARDEEDAKARVARLQYASFDGELIAKVPATIGPLARAFVAVRNVIR